MRKTVNYSTSQPDVTLEMHEDELLLLVDSQDYIVSTVTFRSVEQLSLFIDDLIAVHKDWKAHANIQL